ncbi:bZIP transcription factor 27-like isoform X2 [Diospyros lotus]|uniref:bZIP transcription factor 27-like isoform X2 n=1 Tax=Diospyros lotus TaxID=55363 RepID=UPI00224CE3B7|nr:bZIP transcription factor 27-like isoform X2 [Diospyros lotus]
MEPPILSVTKLPAHSASLSMALSMWSQSSAGDTNQISTGMLLSSSTSHSSSSSARSSPHDILATRKSLEEIWTGINLSSLQRHPFRGGLSLQDLFFEEPPPSSRCCPAAALRPPPPATVLNPSSAPEFHSIESADRKRSIPRLKTQPLKRTSENGGDSGDRVHKRMIQNRESAARSRARKQAYTNQLENEVERLLEENAKLRIQLEKVRKLMQMNRNKDTSSLPALLLLGFKSQFPNMLVCSVAPAGLPKMQTLSRTLTAPF